MRNEHDVMVIGGGPTGLAAAAYLARDGASVTLYEKAATLGGRAATDDRHGYHFNRGAHALYTGGAAEQVLHELGVTYAAGSPKATFVRSGGQCYPLAATPVALMRSRMLDGGDKLAMLRLFMRLPRLDAGAVAHLSARQWLDQTISRPQVRQLIEAVARTVTYTAALDLVSADLLVSRLQNSLSHPVRYVDGGWQTLTDDLERVAREAGVRIVRGAPVVGIERAMGRATAVRTRDGAVESAQAIIVATPAADAARLLPELGQAVATLRPAEVACLDVGLTSLPHPERPVVLDLDGPRFLTAQSVYANVAPAGGGLVHLLKYLDPRQPSDAHQDEHDLEALLDLAQPGWRARVAERRFLPRMQATAALPSPACGGLAGRPGAHVAGLANVLLAGDWVGGEGFLLDAALASARAAARAAHAGMAGLPVAA